MNSVTDIENQLQRFLVEQGLVGTNINWHSQTGGRTNKVWRLTGDHDLICKLYLDASTNPLYANTPLAEFECLLSLKGQSVAPDPHGFVETPWGPVLLYHYIDGSVWSRDAEAVAELLARVHGHVPPAGLRVLSGASQDIKAQGLEILSLVQEQNQGELPALCPDIHSTSKPTNLIHTDVVAGNLIVSTDGLRLIDWQCPALGDPVEDVAMFLSPAMHLVYGTGSLAPSEKQAFLLGLNPSLRERYEKVGKLYHWRMAAYCLWRAEQGQAGYADAATAEMRLLKLM
jgi:hypothetical protein